MDDHLVLHEVDRDGRIVAIVLFDLEDQDAAYAELDARYDAGEGAAPRRFANAATAWLERLWATFDAGDFDAARALAAPGFTWEDRRPLFRLSGDFELMLASAQERLATGARHERRSLVGTAGDRVAVARVLWAGGPPDGRFEVEFLALHEINAAGLCTALIFFDPDDARAVQREAWARWAAIEPDVAATIGLIADLCDAFDAHDPARWRALCADDLVYADHRRTGLGHLEGPDAFVESLVALWDLAPLTRVEAGWFWPAYGRHGAVTVVRRSGTLPEGGAFESEYLELFVQAGGRATHLELFELGDLDAALARFEALRAVSAP
jgi:ketosteroid isomerase-like protein